MKLGVGGLWRTSGEGNEEVLEPRNLGYELISSYRKNRYRVKVSGLADEVVRIRWELRQGGKDGSSSRFGGCYLGLERSKLGSGWDSLCIVIVPHAILTLQPWKIKSLANSFGSWRILFEEKLCQIRFMCAEKQQQKRWAYERFISVLAQVRVTGQWRFACNEKVGREK